MATSTLVTLAVVLLQLSLVLAYLPADYETRTAAAKRDLLWTQTGWEPYPANALPTEGPGVIASAQIVVPTFLTKTFTHVSDEVPEGRQKLIHTFGSCAKAKISINEGFTYTGIFKTGVTGIIRPSLAKIDPTNLLPGMGFKALIDGKPSVNFQVLYSLDGQGANKNFWANKFSNVVADPSSLALSLVSKAFELALKLLPGGSRDRPENANNLPLYEHASVEANGKAVPAGTVRAPWKMDFVPNPELSYSETETADFRTKIAEIPTGTVLFNLVAYRTKEQAVAQTGGETIGQLVTESDFIASKYCDENLFMKHASKPWKQN